MQAIGDGLELFARFEVLKDLNDFQAPKLAELVVSGGREKGQKRKGTERTNEVNSGVHGVEKRWKEEGGREKWGEKEERRSDVRRKVGGFAALRRLVQYIHRCDP